MKDFYVYVDENFPGERELLCDRCSEELSEFWAWFYENVNNEIVLSRFFCNRCKEEMIKDTKKFEPEREIIITTYEEAPESFKRAIKESISSFPEIIEVSEDEFKLLLENPFLLRFWK